MSDQPYPQEEVVANLRSLVEERKYTEALELFLAEGNKLLFAAEAGDGRIGQMLLEVINGMGASIALNLLGEWGQFIYSEGNLWQGLREHKVGDRDFYQIILGGLRESAMKGSIIDFANYIKVAGEVVGRFLGGIEELAISLIRQITDDNISSSEYSHSAFVLKGLEEIGQTSLRDLILGVVVLDLRRRIELENYGFVGDVLAEMIDNGLVGGSKAVFLDLAGKAPQLVAGVLMEQRNMGWIASGMDKTSAAEFINAVASNIAETHPYLERGIRDSFQREVEKVNIQR